MDLFLLKKIISALLMPLSLILILLILAILFRKARPRFATNSLICGVVLLFLAAFGPVSDRLIAPIENQYPAFSRSPNAVDYIVVLGCAHKTDHALPATAQLKPCSLVRLVEALRIYRLHPEASIITSGFGGDQELTNAETMKNALTSLGVSEAKILTENFPKDTEEEAELIAPRISGKNVVLITSAAHMPRALSYFQQQGISPTPAPAGNFGQTDGDVHWGYYVPTPHNLKQTTTAWYEALGLTAQYLKSLFTS